MRNDEHFSMIVLGFAVFLFGCSHLSAIEFNVISEDIYWLYWFATTAGMVMFVNSILTLYLRAQESVSQTISTVTQSNNEAAKDKEVQEKDMRFLKNRKAGVSPASIIMLVVAFLCFAYIAPIALNYLAVAVNTSVNATVKTIAVTVGSILFVLGVVIRFMPRGK